METKDKILLNADSKIDKELFARLSPEEQVPEEVIRPSVTYWRDVWKRLRRNKIALTGLIFIIVITLLSIFVPMLSSQGYSDNNLALTNKGPSLKHWFGTDKLGRDMFVRVFYGARYSLIIGFVASILNLIIGVVYGGIAGYCGGRVDTIMMRIVDIIYSIPMTIYVILLMVVLNGDPLINIIIALAISYWLSMARIVRGEILQLKQQEFVLAARALGGSGRRILFKHLIPNCLGPIIVTLTLQIPSAIFTEAFLSFIGLGIVPPKASWGTLANDAIETLKVAPYQLFFPALAISLTMLAFNLLGDGLTDALDPKMKG
ncbi:ABC transporter permease [Clostridium cellulovorans]|uniref:Binding-protein-dependent transport systems inner membrane component n=1 Tax=Clostridium cellulovorans (strain ATCC 35296 / DSM 3052 / OCM 3 / 743B) TaxID=573061 RepID=D9SVI4_CLOC7|nr:ABC transporter permease [Clostridium cellulovorans]ADL51108.1 binding-protein-dependent transport systems inner membrane component [Clostridium cellulovorans 743B]